MMALRKIIPGLLAIGLGLSSGPQAIAATSNWIGPGSDWGTAGNWDSGVPTDDAGFQTSAPTAISYSVVGLVTLNSMTFNPGASAYTLMLDGSGTLWLKGAGLLNNSGQTQTIVINGGLDYDVTGPLVGSVLFQINAGGLAAFAATAQNATITNFGQLSIFSNNGGANALIVSSGSAATVTFGASSSASSATIVNTNQSTLIFNGTTSGGVATITNDSTLQFVGSATASSATITNNVGGTLSLSNSATLGNATVVNNGFINASAVTSSSWTVGSIQGTGDVQLGAANVEIGANNRSTLITGAINGLGSLVKVGTGTLTLGGANGYTGTTSVNDGTLNVSGSLAGDVTVANSGTLAGTGSVKNIVNLGTVTPGSDGSGTLTATRYSGSGLLNVICSGSSCGALRVTGSADISGTALNLSGSSVAVGQYAVVSAGSLSGTFTSMNAPTPLLTFTPHYSATDASVWIAFATPFAPSAQNANQAQVAGNLDTQKATSSTDFTGAIIVAEQLPASQIASALTQLNGDALASFQWVGLQNAALFTSGMRDRAVSVSSEAYGWWTHALGSVGHMQRNASIGSPASDATTGGFQMGYDSAVGDDLLLGFSGGYVQTSLDVTDRASSGHAKALLSGVYANYTPGNWFANGAFAYTGDSNAMGRDIAFGTVHRTASADFSSRLYTTRVEGGYAFQGHSTFSLVPSLSFRQTHLSQDGFTETGAPGLGLTVADQELNSYVSSLGIRFRRRFLPSSAHPMEVQVHTGWEHELGGLHDALSAHFAETSGGSDFIVEGTPRSRDAGVVGLESRVPLQRNLELVISYAASLSSAETTQNLYGGFRLAW